MYVDFNSVHYQIMPTKEQSFLNMSMKMWKNSVGMELDKYKVLDLVLIQICIYTHIHTPTHIHFSNYDSSHSFSFISSLLGIEIFNNYSIWRMKELYCLGHGWKLVHMVSLHLLKSGLACWYRWDLQLFTPSLRRGHGGRFRYKDSPSNAQEMHAQTVLRITGSN